jgi:hypothetical protein
VESVSEDERKKAAFLAEYRRLCDVYGMMVVMVRIAKSKYRAFALLDMGQSRDELDKAVLEMHLEELQ